MSVASVRRLGRYALHRQIAAGGMASVHLGRLMGPAGFSRTVAIKRLHPQFAQDAHFVTMFLDEARMTGRIVHPNIVSTIDVVQERAELFIVMDFVHGAALSTLVQAANARGEKIELDVAVGILLDTLAGLHAAHEATGDKRQPLMVVHRDVSPHNVLVGVDGLARIADFGIAKARGRVQTTAEGEIKGKLTYMAPEVVRGEDVDRRVDVYAAAVVLWELLAGRKLFSGNEAAILYDVLEAKLQPPSVHRSELPPGLDDVVMKGLARKRDDRYATTAEFSEAIEKVTPRAPARKIGAWASQLAEQDLELRASLIEELESTSDATPPLSATPRPKPEPTAEETAAATPGALAKAPEATKNDSAPRAPATDGSRPREDAKGPVVDAAAPAAAIDAAADRVDRGASTVTALEALPRRSMQRPEVDDDAAPPASRGWRTYAIVGAGIALALGITAYLMPPDHTFPGGTAPSTRPNEAASTAPNGPAPAAPTPSATTPSAPSSGPGPSDPAPSASTLSSASASASASASSPPPSSAPRATPIAPRRVPTRAEPPLPPPEPPVL